MLARWQKALFYILMAIPMRLSGLVYRQWKAPTSGVVKVHLGPGKRNYLPGWINVDANFITAKTDVWADLRNPLPFRDDTVDAFYSHHVIEHLPDTSLLGHFQDMYRCLKPGGVIRIGGPNGDTAIRKYIEGDLSWFSDYPDKRDSIGGKFVNYILIRNEHLTILTPSYLEEIATKCGFSNLRVCSPIVETNHPTWFTDEVLGTEFESTPDAPHTLIIEAVKPASEDAV